jgi:hypothetical protein
MCDSAAAVVPVALTVLTLSVNDPGSCDDECLATACHYYILLCFLIFSKILIPHGHFQFWIDDSLFVSCVLCL